MTDTKQTEALQPDTALLVARNCRETGSDPSCPFFARVQLMDAAYVLERLHAENTTLQQGYDAARLEIEALRGRQCLHGISEPIGWMPIETAPKDSGYLLLRGRREQDVASGYWLQSAYAGNGAWIWPFVHMAPRFWAPLPPSPSSADEGGCK